MTNRLAILIGLFVIGAVTLDVTVYGREHLIYLGKKMVDLIDWMAFWR